LVWTIDWGTDAHFLMRRTEDVLGKLLAERDRLVTDYGLVERTGPLVSWTSFFPGGAGLWQGNDVKGEPLPEFFPEHPYMFVGHNYDGSDSYHKMVKRGWERRNTAFWFTFLAYLDFAKINPSNVFMTNLLMGLRIGKAQGPMEGAGPLFGRQCRAFWDQQIEIVKPCRVVVMGKPARDALADLKHKIYVPHPSACRDNTKRSAQVPRKVAALVASLADSSDFVARDGHGIDPVR
jgi:hypothetical protein